MSFATSVGKLCRLIMHTKNAGQRPAFFAYLERWLIGNKFYSAIGEVLRRNGV